MHTFNYHSELLAEESRLYILEKKKFDILNDLDLVLIILNKGVKKYDPNQISSYKNIIETLIMHYTLIFNKIYPASNIENDSQMIKLNEILKSINYK